MMFREYLLSTLLLILTFEIGLIVQLQLNKELLSEDERTQLVNAVQGPDSFNTCNNEDRLELSIAYDGVPGYSLGDRLLIVTNHSLKPIYYTPADLVIRDYPMHTVYPGRIAPGWESFEEQKIVPGESTDFPLSVLNVDGPFEVLFRYRSGATGIARTFTAHVGGGYVPDGCNY